MQPGPHPDAIDVPLVFRIYAWITITSGTFKRALQAAVADLDSLPSAAAPVDLAVGADSSTISQYFA